MASTQLCKPCDQHTKHTSACHEKATAKVETCHNEHSFTGKVKEMTHKIFDHHKHPSNTGGKARHQVKKTEGQDGHCMPKIFDHGAKKHKKKSHKHKHDGGCNDSGSSSSGESDNEKLPKKAC